MQAHWTSQSSGCSAGRISLAGRRGRGRAGRQGKPGMGYWEHWACWELGAGWACFSVACLCNHINKPDQVLQVVTPFGVTLEISTHISNIRGTVGHFGKHEGHKSDD